MTRDKFLIFLLIIGCSFSHPTYLFSQNDYILVLRKNKKRIYYFPNNVIELKKDDSTYTGCIHAIKADAFLIDSTWIKYQDVQKIIDRNGRHFVKSGSTKFPVAGISFAMLTAFNALVNNERPIFLREHLIPSAGMVALGGIMFPFRNKRYNTKRTWQLFAIPE